MSSRPRTRRGMVTAELAIGLLTASLVLFGASAVIGLLILQDRAEAIAAQAARHAARGDARQLSEVRTRAPRGSEVTVRTSGGWAEARVTVSRSWGPIGPVKLSAVASQPLEPGE